MKDKRNAVEVEFASEFVALLTDSPAFEKLKAEGEMVIGLFPFVLQDIFYALYLDMPKLAASSETSTGARFNKLIIEQLMKSGEFKRSRRFTRGNIFGSGIIAMYFGEFLFSRLESGLVETINEIFLVENDLYSTMTQKQVAERVAVVARGEGRNDCAADFLALGERWEDVAGEKRKQLRFLVARLNLLWNTSGRKNVAISGDGKKGDKEGKFETGFEGMGDNKGVWTQGDLAPHLKLVETYYNSPKLKRLAEKIGRLKQVKRQSQMGDRIEDMAEVIGIDYGNDLSMVVPEEWADFFNSTRKISFHKRYADEGLCLYDMKGKKSKGKGSLIICLDNSGSMQGPKEETSKAITVALMEIAMVQKRDFVVVMFGGPDDECKIFEIPKGKCTFEQLVEIGEHFLCSSGTDFEKPLAEAMKYLEKDKYPGGDIVFITDGVCSVSPEFLEAYKLQKKLKQFRTIAVIVNYGHVSTAQVEAFCDELLLSKDLKGLDVAGELFTKMRRG